MKNEQISDARRTGEGEQEAVAVLNQDCEYIQVTDAALDIYRRERGELIGMTADEVLADVQLDCGITVARVMNGAIVRRENEIIRGDGTTAFLASIFSRVEIDGEYHLQVEIEEVREPKPEEASNGTTLAEMTPEDSAEIARNLRINAPSGEIPLNLLMRDLIESHVELEQTKNAALTLHAAIDARLQEAERVDSNSDQCDVLREAKKIAFGLYLRTRQNN